MLSLKTIVLLLLISNFLYAFKFLHQSNLLKSRNRLNVIPLEISGKVDPSKSWPVKFILNGEEKIHTVKEGTSMLEAAEQIYTDAPYSCRNGVCTTCSAKIVAGRENVLLAVHGLAETLIKIDYVCSCQTFVGKLIVYNLIKSLINRFY